MLICNVDAVAFFSVQPDSVVNMQNRGIAHLSKQQVPEIMLICNVDAVAFFSVQPDSVVNM